MEIKDKTIALLIDSDNISSDYFAILLDELSQYGKVTYRRLYGDFTRDNANGWRNALLEYSIEQIQQVAFTTGKNATDSKMIIDAMDILYGGKVDCFCIATSDSDFTNLAMRFRNDNIIVIGAGEQKTPLSFRRACDIFIPIDDLLTAKMNMDIEKPEFKRDDEKKVKKVKNTLSAKYNKIIGIATDIIEEGADADGWMFFASFMNEIYRKENDFNPKLYGAKSSKPIPFFKSLVKNKRTVFILEKNNNVDKIKINGDSAKK